LYFRKLKDYVIGFCGRFEKKEEDFLMNEINYQYHKTIIGELIFASYQGKLCMLDYRYRRMRSAVDNRIKTHLLTDFVEKDDAILQMAKKQLDEYLQSQRKSFDIPLLMLGTDFQKSVWEALLKVSYGQTASYLDLSKTIGNEKAVRAVANANGANAIGIIIPCHRIIGSNGDLVGYAGGLAAKKRLLSLENPAFSINGQQKLKL